MCLRAKSAFALCVSLCFKAILLSKNQGLIANYLETKLMKTVTCRGGSYQASVFERSPALCLGTGRVARLAAEPYRPLIHLMKHWNWWRIADRSPPFGQVLSFFLCLCCLTLSHLWIFVFESNKEHKKRARVIERHCVCPCACSCDCSGWAVIWWTALPQLRLVHTPASEILLLLLCWLTMLSPSTTTHRAAVRGWQTLMETSSSR